MATRNSFKWVEVIALSAEVEADLCRVLLETEGIQVRIHHSISNRHQPGLLLVTGGVRILVPDYDVIRASVALDKAGYLPHTETSVEPITPEKLRKWAFIAVVIVLLLMGFVYWMWA